MTTYPLNGFLVVDKPEGITSHDVVAMVRSVTGVRKVGHTGTLDPFATGVLPLALGVATRLIQFLDEDLKVYDATIQLGSATDTGDLTGTVAVESPVPADLQDPAIQAVLDSMCGERSQVPPAYSAVKHKGRPLYRYAREGRPVEVEARTIRVDSMELLERGPDWLRVLITCGKGTYARVLGDEIAMELGTRGHLTQLRRRRSGPFGLDGALSMTALCHVVAGREDWQAVLRRRRDQPRVEWRPRQDVCNDLAPRLLAPLAALCHLPVVEADEAGAVRVGHGGAPPPPPEGVEPEGLYVVTHAGELISVARLTAKGPRSARVMPTD